MPAWRSEKIRRPLDKVEPVAMYLSSLIDQQGFTTALGGSLRRACETVGDIDIIIQCEALSPSLFAPAPDLSALPVKWDRLGEKQAQGHLDLPDGTELHVDVWAATEREWGAFMCFVTGPKELNIHMRTTAKRKGMSLDQFGLWRDVLGVPGQVDDGTEKGVFQALGLAYIEPSDRQSWVAQHEGGIVRQEWVVAGTPNKKTGETPSYTVSKAGDIWRCQCPHYQHRTVECKHIRAVKESL